jgi:PiT family inorganic phosphate transporter
MVGAPVSTTHVVATSIMGIGYSERPRAVRWKKAKDIAKTWVITIPAAAITVHRYLRHYQNHAWSDHLRR